MNKLTHTTLDVCGYVQGGVGGGGGGQTRQMTVNKLVAPEGPALSLREPLVVANEPGTVSSEGVHVG